MDARSTHLATNAISSHNHLQQFSNRLRQQTNVDL